MNASEAIIGLGSHAAQDLLNLCELDENSNIMAGPEFTYLGIFLSALAYKEVIDSKLDALAASLDSLKSIHAQAGKSDAKLLDTVATLSIAAYADAMPSWPQNAAPATAHITLSDLLARLLKSSAKVDLNITQKAKLRAHIRDAFEAMKIAHKELHAASVIKSKKQNIDTTKATMRSPFDEIEAAKSALIDQYEDGDITFNEYNQHLNSINENILIFSLKWQSRFTQRATCGTKNLPSLQR